MGKVKNQKGLNVRDAKITSLYVRSHRPPSSAFGPSRVCSDRPEDRPPVFGQWGPVKSSGSGGPRAAQAQLLRDGLGDKPRHRG